MPLHRLIAIVACLILAGCGDDVVGPVQGTPPPTIDPSDVSLYEGSIGLVLDVRPLFKKGYVPTQAELTFPDHPAFDTTLEIDPLTNVAILIIQNDSLTEGQRAAFEKEVMVDIVISDSTPAVLATLVGEPVMLSDDNIPLPIENDSLPAILPPLVLAEGVPYLLGPEGFSGALSRESQTFFPTLPFEQDLVSQEFHLTGTGVPDTYIVQNFSDPQNSFLCAAEFVQTRVGPLRGLALSGRRETPDEDECEPVDNSVGDVRLAELVLETDEGGWVRLKLANTGEYAVLTAVPFVNFGGFPTGEFLTLSLVPQRDRATRFKLVSGGLEWTVLDRGTSFNQPIIPPARLDFAFQANLTNCSASTLTETIGTQVTRTRRTTFGTSESLQVFAGLEASVSMKVGASVGVPVPPVSVGVSSEVEKSLKVTTSLTFQTGNTFEEVDEVATQVSRSRELVVPPFSALTATDIVRTIANVVTPFTQRLRIRARDRKTETPLSGPEILTQIESGFFEGVITRVGGDFVEVTIRGEALTDQFIQAETTVFEVPNACG